MFNKIILSIVCMSLFALKGRPQCGVWSVFSTLTATASSCLSDSNLGAYEVTGLLSALYFPTSSGTITFTGDNGASVTYNAPFSSPINYLLPAKPGHGNINNVTVSFSTSSCTKQRSHSTPNCCSLSVPNSSLNLCDSSTLTLNASGTSGGNYNWSGPLGFTSTLQNPSIPNITSTRSGIYKVYMVNGSCISDSLNVNVNVSTKPSYKNIKHW